MLGVLLVDCGGGGNKADGSGSPIEGGAGGASGAGAGVGGGTAGNGSGGSSSGGFSTGMNRDKQLGTLTQAESDALCASVTAWKQSAGQPYDPGGAMRSQGCRGNGFAAALAAMPATDQAARSACNTGYQTCLAKAPETPQPPTCAKPAATCTATIGELEACENTVPASLGAFAASFPSCDTITVASLTDPNVGKVPVTAECTTVRTKCDGSVPY